jgi:zinc transporter 1/2/3
MVTGSGEKAAPKKISSSSSIESTSLSGTEFGHETYDAITSAEGVSQLIAVGVLEFGVMLHSVIIGLTLAVNEDFITLFIVIIFHREFEHNPFSLKGSPARNVDAGNGPNLETFEGLGLGSRLSQLRLPHRLGWAPYLAGILYSLMT